MGAQLAFTRKLTVSCLIYFVCLWAFFCWSNFWEKVERLYIYLLNWIVWQFDSENMLCLVS